jgi:YbgC/YbaW family acyl-CoA thioester hydrolase
MNKAPHSAYTVRFTDCDPFGHLNNARYIDYFLNAREDHLKDEHQLDLSHFYQQGVSWVVAGHEISYIRPANYNERISIKTALIQLSAGALLVEMIMMNEQQTQLKSLLWTRFIHINAKTGKRETHSDSFMEFARTLEVTEIDVAKGYQHRLKELMEHIKQKN